MRLPNLVSDAMLAIDAAIEDPTDASLKEAFQCNLLRSTSAAQARMAAFMSEAARKDVTRQLYGVEEGATV